MQPPIGGVPSYVTMLARGMTSARWDIAVAGPPGAPDLQALAPRWSGDIRARRWPCAGTPPRDGAAIEHLVRLARRRRVDLVHGHSSKASLLGALAARGAGVPSVYTPHAWAFQMRNPALLRVALGGMEMAINRLHERVITVCGAEAAAARRWHIASREQIRVRAYRLPGAAPAPRALRPCGARGPR
jgi:hypothetical protein